MPYYHISSGGSLHSDIRLASDAKEPPQGQSPSRWERPMKIGEAELGGFLKYFEGDEDYLVEAIGPLAGLAASLGACYGITRHGRPEDDVEEWMGRSLELPLQAAMAEHQTLARGDLRALLEDA